MEAEKPPRGIRLHLRLEAKPKSVFDALADDNQRQHYWCARSQQTQSKIDLKFQDGTVVQAMVLQSERPRRLVLEYASCRLAFTLTADGRGGTILRLDFDDFATGHRARWDRWWLRTLLLLKAWVDFHSDLRSYDSEDRWSDGHVDG